MDPEPRDRLPRRASTGSRSCSSCSRRLLTPLVILSAWNAVQERVKEFMIALLVLETAMIGTFAALDLVLFYVFWEAMLIPMYLLIGIWGSREPALRDGEVLPLHLRRRACSCSSPSSTSAAHAGGTFDYVQVAAGAPGHGRGGALALPRLRRRLRGQGADVPAAHLAARRAHRGAHGRVGHPGRRAPQDGHVRLLPVRAAALPRGGPPLPPLRSRRWRRSGSSTARSCASCRRT